MEPVLDNDSHSFQPKDRPVTDVNGRAIEIRSGGDSALTHSSNGQGSFNSPGYGSNSRDEAEGFDLQRLLSIVLRRWKVMLSIFLAALALGLFSLVRSKPIYQATATIEMTPSQEGQAGSQIPGMQAFMSGAGTDVIETQLENLRGPEVNSRAMATLSPEKRLTLQKFVAVNATQVGMTRLVQVSVQSYDPSAAADLANAICQEYIAVSKDTNRANSLGAVDYVQQSLKDVRSRLGIAQSKLRDYKELTGIFSIPEEASALGEKAAGLQKDLEGAIAERSATQARLTAVTGQLSTLPASRVIPAAVQQNPAVIALQAQLSELQLQRSIKLRDYRPTSRTVRALDSQIAAVKRQISRENKTVVQAWQPDPARAPLAADAGATAAALRSLDARIAELKIQSNAARANMARLPGQEYQFSTLSGDTQVLNQTAQLLNQQLQGLLIAAAARVADARVAGSAQPIPVPVAPNKARVLIYTLGVGLLASLGIGLLLDLMDNHVYSEDDVQRATGLPVLVQVPLFREEQQVNLLQANQTLTGKSSPLLETFRMLRTNIQLSVVDKKVRSVVITSSMPSEGKSHSALNLAVAAATSGDRVILVDLDLRRPSAHRICNLPNEIGFTSVVSNQVTLEEALQETSVPGLRVLTSGPVPPNPFRLLNSNASKSLIERLGNEADLVVIDTPPMLTMADALLISSWVDGTLLVVSSSEMRKRDVSRSADMLFQNNNEVLGTILTKVASNVDGYYSYYGYKNYNHYFESDEAVTHGGEKALSNGSKKT